MLKVAYERREADFRIVWVLNSGGGKGAQIAVQKVGGQPCPWESLLALNPEVDSLPALETNSGCLERDLRHAWGVAFAQNPLPMWIFDQTTLAFLAVNDAAVATYGYSHKEFLSMTILDIRPQDDVGIVLKAALYPHKLTADIERWRHTKKDGSVFIVDLSGRPLIFEHRRAQLISVHKMVIAASR
jgi:PAS domain S-box-containing protein